MSSRPFTFKINAAELFAVVNSLHHKQHSRFLIQFSTDLITLEPVTEYGKKIVSETLEFIKKQSEHGKGGGAGKHRHPKGTLKAPLSNPIGTPYPKEEVKEEVKEEAIPYAEILNDLNSKGGFRYQVCEATKRHIHARYAEKYTKEDFFHVHSVKIKEWKGTKDAKYLRPETLYGNKFQGYLNQQAFMTKTIQNADGDYCEVPI